jgi:hypothetical protein
MELVFYYEVESGERRRWFPTNSARQKDFPHIPLTLPLYNMRMGKCAGPFPGSTDRVFCLRCGTGKRLGRLLEGDHE